MLLARYKAFTEQDDTMINDCVSDCIIECVEQCKELAESLNTKVHVILQRAFQLNLIRYAPFSQYLLSHRREGWRSDEVNFIIDNRNEQRKGIAKVLNRTGSSVSKQMYCLKLMCGGEQYEWKEIEFKYLRALAPTHTIHEICTYLDRHSIDIKHQCMEQGIWLGKAGEEFTRGGSGRAWEIKSKTEKSICLPMMS